MVDCSRMMGICLQVLALGVFVLLAGCSNEKPNDTKSSPTPVVSPEQSPTSEASSGRDTASVSTGASSGSGSSSRDERVGRDLPVTHGKIEKKPEKAPMSPSDWRKQNFKPRSLSDFKELRGYEEVRRLSPQPPNQTTVESGKRLYSQACIACHNLDGSPLRRDPALLKYNMADLSDAGQYRYGSSPKAVFRSIRYGVPSPPMGFTGSIYSRTEVWDMVNYIESLQKKR